MTPDELDLWRQVAATVDAKGKGKARVRASVPAVDPPVDASRANAGPPPEEVPAEKARKHKPASGPGENVPRPAPKVPPPVRPPAAVAAAPKAPKLAVFDRRNVRHLASGKIVIDARLDLHGLRQGEARQQLAGFIKGAHARGHRVVLVITGKGGDAPFDPLGAALGERQRGVLRRLVPQWLEEPGLRSLVVSFTTAGVRHGGEGALYVRLRRADRI